MAKHASLDFISASISLCYGNIKTSREILHMRMQSLLGMVEDNDNLYYFILVDTESFYS